MPIPHHGVKYSLPRLAVGLALLTVLAVVLMVASGCAAETMGRWIKKTPAKTSPSSRYGQSLVYDLSGGRAIMFGGAYSDTALGPLSCYNDTWSYDSAANTWTELNPTGVLPSPRYGQSMIYDPDSGKVFMFGGADETNVVTGTNKSAGDINDLWEYDPVANTWTELAPTGGTPRGGIYQPMIYDTRTRRLLLFVSAMDYITIEDSSVWQTVNELWAYDAAANTWAELEPVGTKPAGRTGSFMVYDSDTGLVLVLGGVSVTTNINDAASSPEPVINTDLWAYDPAKNEWKDLKAELKDFGPSGDGTSRGLGGYFIFHPEMRRSVFLLSMVTKSGELYSRMWSYDASANRWTRLQPAGGFPPERGEASMVFNPEGDEIILYGGLRGEKPNEPLNFTQANIYYNDLWVYDLQTATGP